MFVLTAKLDRKKLLIGGLILLLVVVAVVVLAVSAGKNRRAETALQSSSLKDNAARVSWLEGLGWEVEPEPVEVQTIVIPKSLDGVYARYARLQADQGFDLAKYAGLEAVRYTYRVTNYPGDRDHVVADVVIYRGKVIAGDVQCVELDGFMQGLAYPKT